MWAASLAIWIYYFKPFAFAFFSLVLELKAGQNMSLNFCAYKMKHNEDQILLNKIEYGVSQIYYTIWSHNSVKKKRV